MTDCHILVMSDFHLGARVCRAEKILELLTERTFDTLIINGDLFDSNTTKKLTKKHWEVLETLGEIAKKHKVILVSGNHGRDLDMIPENMGIELRDELAFTVGKRRFLCFHGDEFDLFVKYLPTTSDLFGRLYYQMQRLDGKRQRVSIFTKLLTKRILRVPKRQERMALRKGALRHANVVICSHTHIPHMETKNSILFINSGSFCDTPSTYIEIGKNGETELREI